MSETYKEVQNYLKKRCQNSEGKFADRMKREDAFNEGEVSKTTWWTKVQIVFTGSNCGTRNSSSISI